MNRNQPLGHICGGRRPITANPEIGCRGPVRPQPAPSMSLRQREDMARQGWSQVHPGVWAKVEDDDDSIIATAAWHDPQIDGPTKLTASVPLEPARIFIATMCKNLAHANPEVRRQSMQTLSNALAPSMRIAGDHDEVWADLQDIIGYFEESDDDDVELRVAGRADRQRRRKKRREKRKDRREGRQEKRADRKEGRQERRGDRRDDRQERRKRRRERRRKRVHELAKRLSRWQALQKLRTAYAKVLTSPVADAADSIAAGFLASWGVPEDLTKKYLYTKRHVRSDRLEQGGWSGLVERGTGKGGNWKSMLREEWLRLRDTLKDAGAFPKVDWENFSVDDLPKEQLERMYPGDAGQEFADYFGIEIGGTEAAQLALAGLALHGPDGAARTMAQLYTMGANSR